MDLMFYVNHITTVVEILSAFLLVTEIAVIPIACKKTRSYSFFKCYVFYGYFGLFSWAVSFQLLRFIGNSSLSYLSLNVFLSGFTFHGYLLSSTLLTLNRFSCIAFPLSFDAAWNDRRCVVYMISIFVLTLISVSYRIGAPIEVEWSKDYQAYQWLGYSPVIHSISVAVTLTICFTVCFGSLILNTWTYVSWRERRQTISYSTYKNQRNLFLFSVTCFVFLAMICLQQLTANIAKFSGNQPLTIFLYNLYPPLSSLAILIEPYAILLLCKSVRREFFALFEKTNTKEQRTTCVAKSTQRVRFADR